MTSGYANIALQLLLAVVPVVLAITLHEAAHGYAALAMGDDTARLAGRLSLNPLRHIDRVGTILLPGFLIVSQLLTIGRISFMFGWAKPVPVAAWKFRSPRRGMMVVAAAGPAMNFLLAWCGGLLMHVADHLPPANATLAFDFLDYFILANLVLGLFNLLPIPPLDGGRIMVGVLPERAAMAWARIERYGIVIVLLVVFLLPRMLPEFGIPFNPVGWLLTHVVLRAYQLVFLLAGLGHA